MLYILAVSVKEKVEQQLLIEQLYHHLSVESYCSVLSNVEQLVCLGPRPDVGMSAAACCKCIPMNLSGSRRLLHVNAGSAVDAGIAP